MAGLKRPDVLLTVAGGLRVQGAHDLGAVPAVTGPMRDAGFGAAEAVGRPFRIVAFIPGVADQDQLATDVAGRKLGGPAAAIVERFSGCGGKPAARVEGDGHGDFHREFGGGGGGRRLACRRPALRVTAGRSLRLPATPSNQIARRFAQHRQAVQIRGGVV
jgi:hypothetical protein